MDIWIISTLGQDHLYRHSGADGTTIALNHAACPDLIEQHALCALYAGFLPVTWNIVIYAACGCHRLPRLTYLALLYIGFGLWLSFMDRFRQRRL